MNVLWAYLIGFMLGIATTTGIVFWILRKEDEL